MPPFAVGLAVLYGSVSANLMAVVFEVSMNQIAPHSEDADSNIHERAQHLDDVPAPWWSRKKEPGTRDAGGLNMMCIRA